MGPGKATCHCARGELHASWSLSFPGPDGKPMTVSMNPERLARYQGPAEDYRRFRTARARLVKRHKELLKALGELEGLLLIPPPGLGRK